MNRGQRHLTSVMRIQRFLSVVALIPRRWATTRLPTPPPTLAGNTATETRTVNVVGTTPPVIIVADPISFWPANHKYVTIAITQSVIAVTDACAGNINVNNVIIISVSSDEPEDVTGGGDGNTTEDIVIADDCQSVQVRRERQGSGNGRVYTIELAVPKSQNGNPAIDDDPIYTVVSKCGSSPAAPAFAPSREILAIEGNVIVESVSSELAMVAEDAVKFIVVQNHMTGTTLKIPSGLSNGATGTFRLTFNLTNTRAVRAGDFWR